MLLLGTLSPPTGVGDMLLSLFHNSLVLALLLTPLVLIVADVLTGVLSAILHHTFTPARLSDYLGQDVVRYIGLLVIVWLVWLLAGASAATDAVSALGVSTLAATLLHSIVVNVMEVFQLPTTLAPAIEQQVTHLVPPIPVVGPPPPPPPSPSSPSSSSSSVPGGPRS